MTAALHQCAHGAREARTLERDRAEVRAATVRRSQIPHEAACLLTGFRMTSAAAKRRARREAAKNAAIAVGALLVYAIVLGVLDSESAVQSASAANPIAGFGGAR